MFSDGTDNDARKQLTEELERRSSEITADTLVRRHVLSNDGTYKTSAVAGNFSDIGREMLKISSTEIVEIWCDESRVTSSEVLQRLVVVDSEEVLVPEDEYSWWYELSEICEAENLQLPELHLGLFVPRPPVFLNGCCFLVPNDDPSELIEVEEGVTWPLIDEIVGWFSIIEYESRTSGTDYRTLGFSREGILVDFFRPDVGDAELRVWSVEGDDVAELFATWLLSDYDGAYLMALCWIEGEIGKLPDVDDLPASWFDEDMSSTLILSLASHEFSGESKEKILAQLLQVEEIATYVRGITNPDSPEGVRRLTRQQNFEIEFGLIDKDDDNEEALN